MNEPIATEFLFDRPVRLYHDNDPTAGKTFRWHFVYLHGEAEALNDAKASAEGWQWAAPDMFSADQLMPEREGTYEAVLYGRPAIIFVRIRFGNALGGRVALKDDAKGLAHASKPEEWC